MTPYRLSLMIPGLPKRVNQSPGAHWRARFGEANKWKKLVVDASIGQRPAEPLKRARLTLVRASSSDPDPDGLVSSFKHCIDGLILACVIENDKSRNIGMPEYRWEKAPRGQGYIRIIVEEVCE